MGRSAGCRVDGEWTTLVNPRRDIGRTDIHGIQAGDVAAAPLFEEITPDVAVRLYGPPLRTARNCLPKTRPR